ncbi:hypothetical protein PVAG01_03829 [Phlyctema vagabunda]|uniref:Uncharacterized protein n=1 Tax=Phlyctema vagabunda TaxID=108571 RepID=A0ABR4PMI5_9HELO
MASGQPQQSDAATTAFLGSFADEAFDKFKEFENSTARIPQLLSQATKLYFKFDECFNLNNFKVQHPTAQVICLGGLQSWQYHINQTGSPNIRRATLPFHADQACLAPLSRDPTGMRKKTVAWGYVIAVDEATEEALNKMYSPAQQYSRSEGIVHCLNPQDIFSTRLEYQAFFYHKADVIKDYNQPVLDTPQTRKAWREGLSQLGLVGGYLGLRMDIHEVLQQRAQREGESDYDFYVAIRKVDLEIHEEVFRSMSLPEPDLLLPLGNTIQSKLGPAPAMAAAASLATAPGQLSPPPPAYVYDTQAFLGQLPSPPETPADCMDGYPPPLPPPPRPPNGYQPTAQRWRNGSYQTPYPHSKSQPGMRRRM